MAKKRWSEVREEVLAKAGTKVGKRTEVAPAAPAAPRQHGKRCEEVPASAKTASVLNTFGR